MTGRIDPQVSKFRRKVFEKNLPAHVAVTESRNTVIWSSTLLLALLLQWKLVDSGDKAADTSRNVRYAP